MNYKKLGNTDLKVSTICLGTMTWGEQNSQNDGFEQMNYALDQGVNFWDTAEIYSVPPKKETFGHTETIIGNWFEKTKKREKVILASKVCGPMREYVRGGGNQFGEKNIKEALEGSLGRLKTDHIDLYQLHWPERKTNFFGKLGYEHDDDNEWTRFEDILGSIQKFIEQGKIKYVGVSNETPWGLSRFLQIANEQKLPRMLSVQNPYNLLNRTYEIGLAEMSVREQSGLLAYSPLACGYLSGKYRNNQLPKNSRMERDGDFWTRYVKPNTDKAIDKYYEIAKKYNLDLSQMALKFLEIQPFVTSVIIGATTMEQLKTNIDSVNISLSDDIINEINEVQKIYPNPCP
ncbi:aldo/keto reductase [Candidatus Pelagibacter sp.]|jgi:aryl-alcohol dehydrogenase-like predicted oxidoreductase|nr:aldo/keto reductase [Candidatus Pelagibacter sp.]MDA9956059.1 aldo/keto reductase [Candidatus Pelagibacter sp.]